MKGMREVERMIFEQKIRPTSPTVHCPRVSEIANQSPIRAAERIVAAEAKRARKAAKRAAQRGEGG